MSELRELVARVKANQHLVRASTSFAKSNKIDVAKLLAEIEMMQSIRVANKLDVSATNLVEQLISSSARDTAYRSRVAEILFKATRTKHLITSRINNLRDILNLQYKDLLYSVYRTQADRNMFLDQNMREFSTYSDSLTKLIESARIVVDDIDKAAWSLKLILEAVSVHKKAEYCL